MHLLNTLLKALPEYQTLKEHSEHNIPCAITGLGAIHRAHMTAALHQDTGRQVLVVCQDDLATARMAEELTGFLGETPPVLPTRELCLLGGTVSRGWEQQRLGMLYQLTQGGYPVLLASAEALSLRTIPPSVLGGSAISLVTGGSYNLDELLQRLTALGYRRSTLVEGAGQFALRGGILDVYSPAAPGPIRVEFWGDELDSMGYFDVTTQRRTENVDSALLLPTAEVLPELHPGGVLGLADDIDNLLARQRRRKHKHEELMATLQQDADALRGGALFSAADRYAALIYPEFACAMDYVKPETIVIFSDRMAVERTLDNHLDEISQGLDALLQNGTLAGELCDFYKNFDELCNLCRHNCVIYMDNFLSAAFPESLPPQELLSVTVKQLPSYGGSLDTAVSDLAHYQSTGFGVLVLCGARHRAELLLESLEARGLTAQLCFPLVSLPQPGQVLLTEGSLASGMEYPSLKIAILTEGQITSAPRKRPGRKKKKAATNRQKLNAFTDLSPGDLVVHEAHGIGRFCGVEQMKLSGVVKDYIKIAYQGTDVLYVPATQLDMVAKYIGGGEDSNVRLSRLGGDTWEKTKKKAKAAAQDLADGLIQLYAQRKRLPGYAFSPDCPWQAEFEDSFPYAETDDQLRCIDEIKADMEAPTPMDRLLCGDVGFGKTEVALRAAMKCIMDGKQCAILVPTTVLAQQHYVTAKQRFSGFPVNIDVLSRFRSSAQQRATLHAMSEGTVDLIVGTHKLLQKSVQFKNLGLLIVDEEQRFGVTHKERLKELARGVDTLTLSATPIPRTLNMALSGLRDLSTIEEPPSDRYPVQTYVIEHDYDILANAIRREIGRGGQVYYLHNRVDSIQQETARLQKKLPEVAFGIAHGKMNEEELSDVMQQMADGDIQVMVCTTIIETGIDIPNVNTLIIEDADKLGLAQLHQLRGRVGRSNRHAYAYLTFRKGKVLSEIAEKRLSAIREFAEFGSGFKIAMRDLEIRGAGNLLGAEQSGHMISVGYDMYLRLLEEAVLEKKGEAPVEEKSCSADLNISANIPENYVSSGEQRMDLYRRIASIRQEIDADDVLDELIDRYGEPPKPVVALVNIALLRSQAAALGIQDISQKGKNILFTLRSIDFGAVSGICADPVLKKRVLFSAGDSPKLTLSLVSGEDPLKVSEQFVRKYADFHKVQPENDKISG